MPQDSGSRARNGHGFALAMRTSRMGFDASMTTSPFSISLVTWTRRFARAPYALRIRTARAGPFSLVRLRETTPSCAG